MSKKAFDKIADGPFTRLPWSEGSPITVRGRLHWDGSRNKLVILDAELQ